MKKFIMIIMMLMVCFTGTFAGDKQLELVSTSIEDGSTDVTVTPVFELEFSNNVINMKVKDANMALIKMVDASGKELPIIVEMGDDQVSPELKRLVTVKADGALEEGESYQLIIQKGFSAKNGTLLKDDVVIGFETEGGQAFSLRNIILILAVCGIVILGFVTLKKKNA